MPHAGFNWGDNDFNAEDLADRVYSVCLAMHLLVTYKSSSRTNIRGWSASVPAMPSISISRLLDHCFIWWMLSLVWPVWLAMLIQGTFQCRHCLRFSARAFPASATTDGSDGRSWNLNSQLSHSSNLMRRLAASGKLNNLNIFTYLHMSPGLTGTPVLNTTSKEQMPSRENFRGTSELSGRMESVADDMLLGYGHNRSP